MVYYVLFFSVWKLVTIRLKQHYVTLTETHCFEKQNLTMHIQKQQFE